MIKYILLPFRKLHTARDITNEMQLVGAMKVNIELWSIWFVLSEQY